jgi:hypothetical protein
LLRKARIFLGQGLIGVRDVRAEGSGDMAMFGDILKAGLKESGLSDTDVLTVGLFIL